MADINRTAYFYRHKFKGKETLFNKPGLLPSYFKELIGDKKEVRIAELGSGPVNTIGNEWPGVAVTVIASDILWPEYQKFWKEKSPIVSIEYQDMEKLTYQDESFDIVHCRNALDHTPNFFKALEEMKRVCKVGGWIYLAHAPGQKTRYGGMHSVDFETIKLPGFTSEIKDGLIINTWQKTSQYSL